MYICKLKIIKMNKVKLPDSFSKEISRMDFGDYFKQYSELSKKQFLISDLGLSARTFQQWKELEITPPSEKDNTKEGKREWVRFNFIEFLWMKMLISLRDLGYPYADIKKAKEFLFTTHDLGVSMNRVKNNSEIVNDLTDFYTKDNLPDDIKAVLIEAIKNPIIIDKISNLFSKKSYLFELLIFDAINNKNKEMGIGFFEKGDCLPFDWNLIVLFDKWGHDINKEDVLNNSIRKPHIYISITKFIMDFITEDEKQERELILSMMTDEENNLLRELRSKDYKNIIINYDKGTDTKIIKTEKEKKIKESEIKDFIKNIVFAPNCKSTYTKTKKGDLIIDTISTKKLNT